MTQDRYADLRLLLAALDAGEEIPIPPVADLLAPGLTQGEIQGLRADCAARAPRAPSPTLAPVPRRSRPV